MLMAAAGLFNFKMILAVYAGWLSLLPSIALLPLLLAAFLWAVRSPGLPSGLAVAAAGALCLHGGHLQLVYYLAWFLVAYLLVVLARSWAVGRRREALQVGGWLGAGGLLAVGMAAYLLLLLAAEVPLTSRVQSSDAFLYSGFTLRARHLLTLVYPEALGTPLDASYPDIELWEDVAYFGLVPLLLAPIGAVLGRRRPPTGFLLASSFTSVLLPFSMPLLRLAYPVLPGFPLFRLPGRLLFLAPVFGIALAGIGLEELLARLRREGPGRRRPHLAAGMILVVIAGEGTFYAREYLRTVPQSHVLPAVEFARLLAADRTLFRTAPLGGATITYGWAAANGLQLISGYEPFTLRHYQHYLSLMQAEQGRRKGSTVWTDVLRIARWDMLDALNVKYLVAPVALPFPPDRLELVAHFRDQAVFVPYNGMARTDVFVYRNRNALPRAFWVERVVHASGEQEARDTAQRNSLRDLAVVQGPGAQTTGLSGSPDDRVTVVRAADGYLVVETESRTNRFLVISEIWHPGWRARLDGGALPLRPTDLALMGAWIPAGRHRVVLEFRPAYWRGALSLSLVSGTVFLTWLAVWLVRFGKSAWIRLGNSSVAG